MTWGASGGVAFQCLITPDDHFPQLRKRVFFELAQLRDCCDVIDPCPIGRLNQREYSIFSFHVLQPMLGQVFAPVNGRHQPPEAREVTLDPFLGEFGGGAGPQDEAPIG